MASPSAARERPLADIRIEACLHVAAELRKLVRTLVAGGAQVRLYASNSTQDDIAAALAKRYGVPTKATPPEPGTCEGLESLARGAPTYRSALVRIHKLLGA